MIVARGIGMDFGSVRALADVSFEARRGEVLGLLGPNGAGKSTTMRVLTTFLEPTEGSAEVDGHDVVRDAVAVRRAVGYLPESVPLYPALEVREALEFVGGARGLTGAELERRIGWVSERCGLDRMMRTPCLELSKGFRQRAALAQALIHDPRVVILDEPTSGLDPHQVLGMRALIRELREDRTVVLSTHVLFEAEGLADRLVVIDRGRVVGTGTTDELRAEAGLPTRVVARIELRADDATAREALLAVSCAFEFDVQTATLDVADTDGDLDRRIAAAVEGKGLLLELRREPPSLEAVFLALTARAREGGGTA